MFKNNMNNYVNKQLIVRILLVKIIITSELSVKRYYLKINYILYVFTYIGIKVLSKCYF